MTKLKAKYDFSRGHPNPSLLPVKEMKQIMAAVANGNTSIDGIEKADDENDRSTLCLNYGHEAGSPDLLKEIRSFLDRQTISSDEYDGVEEFAENQLFVTNGVSHGIELICSTFTSPGDVVFVERPTYFLVADIFRSHGLRVSGLPMVPTENNAGAGAIDVSRLVEMVDHGELNAPSMIYLIPTHQNPTGHTLSVKDRRILSDFSERHGVLLVADEVYHLLDWRNEQENGRRPARMAAFNKPGAKETCGSEKRQGCCLSVSSFTKIFAPGVRCGWIEAPASIICSIVQHGYIQSQGGVAPFVGDLLMFQALKMRLVDGFLRKLRERYSERAHRLCATLQLDDRISLPNGPPTGGYFLWIEFPRYVDAEDFLRYCEEGDASKMGLRFRPGTKCDAFANETQGKSQVENDAVSAVSMSSFRSCARLCFADLDDQDLIEGGRRLVRAFGMYMKSLPDKDKSSSN